MDIPRFGGPWTQEKLDILRRYLDAYTTALKNQPFTLTYIDAFAGAPTMQIPKPEYRKLSLIRNGIRDFS
ncbi:MAG: three-Cys-motif partner protein TcmP [Candidatus Tectomicrobia bacterium]|nr:three-Cys-motif partner protein TcmP [Candidatus Tectomicrobia bacterium]